MPHDVSNRWKLFWGGAKRPYDIAECYRLGKIVKRDVDLAISFYQEAIETGDPRGYWRLGQYYEQRKDMPSALEQYFEGACCDNIACLTMLKDLYNLEKPYSVEAGFCLARIFKRKSLWRKALDIYLTLAEQKNGKALFLAGDLYEGNRVTNNEIRIKVDKKRAFDFYREALATGWPFVQQQLNKKAQQNVRLAVFLGKIYLKGLGCLPKDSQKLSELKDRLFFMQGCSFLNKFIA